MSTYTIYSEDLEAVLTGNLLAKQSSKARRQMNGWIALGKYSKFKIKNAIYNNVYVGENQCYFTENAKMYSDVKGETIIFTVMNHGNLSYSCSSINESTMDSNTFNIFYLNNEVDGVTTHKNNIFSDSLDISISKTLFDDMLNRHPEILRYIGDKINKKYSFALFENGRPIDHRMLEVLNHIKTANLLGNAAPMLVEAKVLELFALLSCNKDNCKEQAITCLLQDKMYEAKYIIEEQYENPPTIDGLAKHLGICSTTMKQCFKNVFNNTVYGYLFDYRMKKAEEFLINNPELNIFEIAQKLGYEHQTNFGVAFRRKYGVTPKEFRRSRAG